MSLTSSMLVGYTGIQSNTVGVDTVGDNLANLNTTAFKTQRVTFETLLYRTYSEGEPPGEVTGGTLPFQIGTGSTVSSIQRNFSQGGLDATGLTNDLAMDGEGYFILADASGGHVYTRDGSFMLDADQRFVSAAGLPVQVFPADDEGNIDPSRLTDLIIPIGSVSNAVATTEVVMDGRLDTVNSNIASAGAVVVSQPLLTADGSTASSSTALTSLVNDDGIPLFADGDDLTITASKGGVTIPANAFVVGSSGNTLGDLARHMEAVFGINADPATGGTPGVTIAGGADPFAGSLVIRSNLGEINAVTLDGASVVNRTNTAVPSPFAFTTTQEAVGAGETTTLRVFDSLGNDVDMRIRVALESKSENGSTWRFYAESTDDTDLSPVIGTGTITFDTNGGFVGATGTNMSIDRASTGAASPLGFTLDFTKLTSSTAPDGDSQLIMDSQNGAPSGILMDYRIEEDGSVIALYSNDTEELLAQVAVATFVNQDGLTAMSDNTFVEGPNSGEADILAPLTGTAGRVVSGALEQSNVEIAREFINLISSSTGISSASRVVRAADDLLQELLLLAR